ncbi:plasmid replication, integration and excision activator [Yinghuangia sp. ASG 101]|uniref:plasmid replication, integration and excision activator n=1 Tax=Yinghuangia sp. ASG 101 TaxID=2896848 RepID=UPI001E3BDEAD|nr:plasmid replication, integration and excision activator [Yinghuangia sp. ASG 101]UGQ08938.1 plasmid replication, integration and excision activator [Yinghuangia sp. ASG 101]
MALQIPIPVQFGAVFPAGAFATRVEAVADFEASKSGQKVQARDKATGLPMWVVTVSDPDPLARDSSVRIKIPASDMPVLPDELPGLPFRPVEFVGLAVTPYVNNSGRVAYSLRADGLRPVGGVAKQTSAKTAA